MSRICWVVLLLACSPGPGGGDGGAPFDAGTPGGAPFDAGTPLCRGAVGEPGEPTQTLAFGGVNRTYFLHFPPGYDGRAPAPLLLNFHGFDSNADEQEARSRITPVADDAGVVTLHAWGVGKGWNDGACCGEALNSGVDDVGFVGALLDDVIGRYCIDPRRVYAMGFSNGASLSHRLGCELSRRVAAVGSVAGVMGVPTCAPARPVPVIDFHGTADTGLLYVESTMQGWAERDGCGTTATVSYQNGDATCRRFVGCPAGVDVELCIIDGGGHTWPGGRPIPSLGKTSVDVSASGRMMEFFLAHPQP